MAITVDQLTTEVIPEPESASAGAPSEPWRDAIRVREAAARVQRDRSRTAAEGFDD